ncbi:MAG: hypothetical protein KDD48_09020 [Bdellovibrionales bacterium]|nr:hypothetical protein [Bdellovibrionales bacterium]
MTVIDAISKCTKTPNDLDFNNFAYETPKEWVDCVQLHFSSFLADHASNERKAAAAAMDFVVRYPNLTDLVSFVSNVAQQEILHFRNLFSRMLKSNFKLLPDQKSYYTLQMQGAVRTSSKDRLMDRILISAIFEKRGQERFQLLSKHHDSSDWRIFYQDLYLSEQGHWYGYLDQALKLFEFEDLKSRWAQLCTLESQILKSTPLNERLFP